MKIGVWLLAIHLLIHQSVALVFLHVLYSQRQGFLLPNQDCELSRPHKAHVEQIFVEQNVMLGVKRQNDPEILFAALAFMDGYRLGEGNLGSHRLSPDAIGMLADSMKNATSTKFALINERSVSG